MSGHSFPSSSWMFASPPCKAGFVMFGFWVRSAPHGTPRITCGGGEGDTPNRAAGRTQTGLADPETVRRDECEAQAGPIMPQSGAEKVRYGQAGSCACQVAVGISILLSANRPWRCFR